MQTWRIFLVLLVAVGSHPWTEAHDMNKALNRTCALEVLPDYHHYGGGSGDGGLSYPAGGLVIGRPFFFGGQIGHPLFTPFFYPTRMIYSKKQLGFCGYLPSAIESESI